MKAIIPVAGTGARLRPHTYTQPKALLPLAGKTILDFIIDQLSGAGISEFIFIIGYLGEKIEEYVSQAYPSLQCHYVFQAERKGTGQAVALAKDIVGNDEVFIIMGDTICDFDIKEVLNSPTSMIGIQKVGDPRGFGVAEIDENGFVTSLIEKPRIPLSNMALVGLYKIKETDILFRCLSHIYSEDITTEGQYQLTDALHCMINNGAQIKSFKVKHWYDCGRKETLLETNALLLKKYGNNIHSTASINNSIIIPPVSIGADSEITNSIVGPHIAIGANSNLEYSIVRDCIIGSFSTLHEVVLDNSLIGNDASVKGLIRTLNIGDNTEIDFG
ncbi:MAG: sugar phosphate nucleotidyltransferase [Arachidicoccus sp.]|nr:sugar phosphate nucleotidyltransferase [Arachidicoccus sp.]